MCITGGWKDEINVSPSKKKTNVFWLYWHLWFHGETIQSSKSYLDLWICKNVLKVKIYINIYIYFKNFFQKVCLGNKNVLYLIILVQKCISKCNQIIYSIVSL